MNSAEFCRPRHHDPGDIPKEEHFGGSADPQVVAPGCTERSTSAVTVYLGLGSNLGNRLTMLQRALDALGILPGTSLLRCSRVYETAPWGYTDQDAFYNCVVALRCALPPRALMAALHAIERELGRERRVRNGPRNIDLDILLYGDGIIQQEGLTIPHPSMAERNFVLQPLREIAPDLRHPVEGLTITDMAERCSDNGAVFDTGHRLEAGAGHVSTVLPALFAILRGEDVVADATEEKSRP